LILILKPMPSWLTADGMAQRRRDGKHLEEKIGAYPWILLAQPSEIFRRDFAGTVRKQRGMPEAHGKTCQNLALRFEQNSPLAPMKSGAYIGQRCADHRGWVKPRMECGRARAAGQADWHVREPLGLDPEFRPRPATFGADRSYPRARARYRARHRIARCPQLKSAIRFHRGSADRDSKAASHRQ
jgi:hypothetical protein